MTAVISIGTVPVRDNVEHVGKKRGGSARKVSTQGVVSVRRTGLTSIQEVLRAMG